MDAPCVDIFDYYPERSIIFTQLGAIENLKAAIIP